MRSIGSYEAKTHFAQLLDAVERGETIMITRHGVPVARLIPSCDDDVIDANAAVDALFEFQHRHPVTLDGLSIKEMIEEGRP
jgi:prevent-host-death family protein